MTTTVLLIRHASHDRLNTVLCGRIGGVHLSEAGRTQALRLAMSLKAEPVETVFCSPLERARETAQAIADETGAALCATAALTELDFGAWSGRTFEDLPSDPEWERWNRLRQFSRPPGGETMTEAQARTAAFMEELRVSRRHSVVAAVSHCDVIKALLAWALGLPLAFYDRFEISPASVSRLALDDWGVKVWSLNQVVAP